MENIYDVIMLVVLVAAAAFGFWKGLIWQLASVASIVVSYFVAYEFRGPVAQMIDAAPPWNMFLAMLLLYIGTSAVVWLAFGLLRKFIDKVKLKDFDRQIGALLGLAKGALLCVVITFFVVTLAGDELRDQVVHSHSGYWIAVALDEADAIMPEEVHNVIGPHIDQFGDHLNRPLHANGDGHSEAGGEHPYQPVPLSIPGPTGRTGEGAERKDDKPEDDYWRRQREAAAGRTLEGAGSYLRDLKFLTR